MSSGRQDDHKDNRRDKQKDAMTGGREGNEHTEPRARGTPGSFDQPTPREEFMPRQGGRPTRQTAEVPLGTGEVSEPPGGGGLPSRRAPHQRGMAPSNSDARDALRSRTPADEKHDAKGETK